MDKPSYSLIKWDNLHAIQLNAYGYEAIIVPSLGANVIKLTYNSEEKGYYNIIRTPSSAETLRKDPFAYGIPILFPPNRIKDGQYTYDDITYDYPRNYPNNVHIHGILHNNPWQLVESKCDRDSAAAVLEINTVANPNIFKCIPVNITFRLENTLSSKGLLQRFKVINNSTHIFPFGLAYHTSFNVPFRNEATREDIRLQIPILARCADDEVDRLPNGECIPLNPFEEGLASPSGYMPLAEVVDNLYTAKPNTGEAVFKDNQTGHEVVYSAGKDNHYWIIWNKTATEGFIAVEPQTCISNAIKMPTPEKFGAIFIQPEKTWTGDTSIFVR